MLKLFTFLLPFLLLTISSDACTPPVFTLHNITYGSSITYSTPAHLAVAEGQIEFNLTNTAIPYTTHCSGFSSRLSEFFYGEIVYQCDAPTGEGVNKDASAKFTFSKPDGAFNVNQTWSCGNDEHYNM
jgi:hypothetical protein